MTRNIRYHLILTFLFAFFFIGSYWIGLPTDFNSDHITINLRGANASTYSDLIQRTLNPLSPYWFYPTDRMMEYLRPLQFLWMKTYFDLFADSLIPFHVTAAVGFGLLSALFFFLVHRWTGSKLYGWLAVILYLSFPSNYFTLTSTFSGDFQQFISILSISALLLFARLATGKTVIPRLDRGIHDGSPLTTYGDDKSLLSFLLKLLACIVLIWLAIKLKSSEKILPFVCLGFLLWRFRAMTSRIRFLRTGILALAALSMLVLVVPSQKAAAPQSAAISAEHQAQSPGANKDKTTFNFHWKNMLQRTFFVPGGDFPFLTPYRKKVPGSFSESLGFPLVWFFWLSALCLPFAVGKRKEQKEGQTPCDPDLLENEFWILAIWFAATIAGFANGLTVHDTRFLNFAYVPGVLLFFMGLGVWERQVRFLRQNRLIARLVVAAMILYTAVGNFGFYTGLARHFGGMQWTRVEAAKDIFRSVMEREPEPWELYLKHSELQNRFMVIDWYNLPSDWLEQAREKINAEGKVFFYTRGEDSERLKKLREAGYKAKLWNRYDFYEAPTVIHRFFKAINDIKMRIRGRAKKHEVLVYLIQPGSQS